MPASKFVELDTGLRYHFLEWPSGSDHTVILLHGFLDNAHTWEEVAAELGDEFHVVAPDMRGFGDSDRVGKGGYYHFADYIADLDAFWPNVAREKTSIVGHSMGGMITGYFAGAFPERPYRAALLEGLGPPETGTVSPERVRNWIDTWRYARNKSPKSYKTLDDAAAALMKNDKRLRPQLAHRLAETGTTLTADGIRFKHDPIHLTRGPYGFQISAAAEFWQRISCPTLLVEGSDTDYGWGAPGKDDYAERRAYFKGARYEILQDAGHMMQRHQPKALAKLLAGFLR